MIRATFKSRVQEIIASEPNKFMEIIMPFTKDIKREQRFIVDGEAWYVIEFDSSSVDGITYITLGEDKKDLQQDLLIDKGDVEDLANYRDENKFYISVLEENPIVEIGTSYYIKPFYYEEGNLKSATFNFYANGILLGTGSFYEQVYTKDTTLIITLAKKEEIFKIIEIKVSEEPQENITYKIIGDDNIKWGKTSIYNVEAKSNGIITQVENVTYSIADNELASIEFEDGVCYIKANEKRKVGNIVYIEKNIRITSLW